MNAIKTTVTILLIFYSVASLGEAFTLCSFDKDKQLIRSKELAEIVKADQDARKNFQNMSQEDMERMSIDDSKRRMRIGEIFGEGCFSHAEDYSAAALVFQHGVVPEHFFQTFLWAKKAVELGDNKQMRLMALGLDRYLVNSGYKQLFASQAIKPNDEKCWCLHQIEKSFPEKIRKKYMGNTLEKQISWVNELNKGQLCPNIYCAQNLKKTPRGTVLGFW